MPTDNTTRSTKPAKGRQRAARKKQDPQQVLPHADSMTDSQPVQGQGQFLQQPHYSSQPPQATVVPSSTPSRKRPGRNSKQNARNGYHSDTGTTHYGQSPRHHSASQSVDAGHLYAAAPGPSPAGQVHGATPPHAVTATPTKQQVYAGPTFLASPAASSLPMPKSLAKTMPSGARRDVGVFRQDSESETTGSMFESPTKVHAAPQAREGSPLDMLFNADRAEKSSRATDSVSPLSQVRSAGHDRYGKARREIHQSRRGGTPGSASNKEMFMMEMNGNGNDSDSEEHVRAVPFKERMQAIAEAESPSSPRAGSLDQEDLQRQAKTRALKQLLLGPSSEQGRFEPDMPAAHPQGHGPAQHYGHRSQSGQWGGAGQVSEQADHASGETRQTVRPSAASPSPQDLRAMEENLRRVLKLGPGS